ncbi:MAG: abortive infection system antitoxin AbiGi family protein [Rhizomicrobium sp.]|jgi:hypothetical protein
MAEAAPERFFYHSFPRRSRFTPAEIEEGCTILGIIRDHGLALVPQVMQWEYPHADGSPNRTSEVMQQRVCFTELPPAELSAHATKFGRFAIEFRVPVLKALGAIPVFYIPRAVGEVQGAEWAANIMVMQLQDAYVLALRLAGLLEGVKKASPDEKTIRCTLGFTESGLKDFNLDIASAKHVFEILTYALTPPDMLAPAFEAAMRYFVPADDLRQHEELSYYREREWRIAANVTMGGKALLQEPSQDLIDRLKALDPKFFAETFHPSQGDKTRADLVSALPGLNGRSIVQLARRIIVPKAALKQAREIFRDVPDAPPIVTLESVNQRSRLEKVMRLLTAPFRRVGRVQ